MMFKQEKNKQTENQGNTTKWQEFKGIFLIKKQRSLNGRGI